MPYCIVKDKTTDHVWTTELRYRPVYRLERREHMLECHTESQALVIARRQGGHVVPLDADADFRAMLPTRP